ncbi:hypothetical protein LWI29_003348 [Acer saccharum]|uniref:Pre-mRNA-splicing factor SYF2 n=1 Tax=Acer saccharum TaxID=4024 RepID=A0AA39RUN6_ACESA|nr:hypothetical protein LWI29_003348 [Acer saccharum]
MAENRRVHPNCVNASNPYHECGMACLEKIAQGQGQGQKEKKKFAGSWSFGRKKKGTETQPNSPLPMSPRVLNNVPIVKHHQDARFPRSEVYSKKKVESENDNSFSSSEQFSGEIFRHDQSFDKDQDQSTQSVPASRNVMKADRHKDPSKENFTSSLGAILLTEREKEGDANFQDVEEGNANVQDVEEGNANVQDVEEGDGNFQDAEEGNANQVAYMKFSFSSIDRPPEDSDDEEALSVISDSCVSVGKYHVKARISSLLQSIFDKYGDIAANCRLESASMRAYYLECLCSVVQELQSTSLMQMTKTKVREMLAVLKDVETAQINVDWLRDILNEVSEAIDVVTQHQTIETAKANCDNLLESTRKELESQMKDLSIKEKELTDTKARVSATRARVSELESESSQLNKTIESMKSKPNNQSVTLDRESRTIIDFDAGDRSGLEEEVKVLRKMEDERRVHPDCINASNPYHECVEYCFIKIAEAMARMGKKETEVAQTTGGNGKSVTSAPDVAEDLHDDRPNVEEDSDSDNDRPAEENVEVDLSKLTGRQKKMFELRLKMNEARKANQTAMIAEKKRIEAPAESRGISKQKWLEERKKKIGKLLDANGLDMKNAFMLDTQEAAEAKYKKWEKDPAPFGWDVFNQKTLYNAYKKRTKNVNIDLEEYNKMKETDPEFYREASSLQYGKAPKISEDKIDKMVKELKDRDEKRKSFSRRRKFHDDKDIDSINDRNEHFNKKIERAFGKYTLEIKNNLERGTALPD